MPKTHVALVPAKHDPFPAVDRGPRGHGSVEFQKAGFPDHRIATRARETGRWTSFQSMADQQISTRMSHIVAPEHHLLGETTGSIVQNHGMREVFNRHGTKSSLNAVGLQQ
jgi:hypothetical protein